MYGIFLDIETTGLDPGVHAPIDIACTIVDLTKGTFEGQYQSVVAQPAEVWEKRDPVSIEINGFTWDEIVRGKQTATIGQELIAWFATFPIQRGSAVFICQNPAFDRAFFNQFVDVYLQERLNWPYHWLDLASMFWAVFARKTFAAGQALPETISLSKNEIAKRYNIPEEQGPHRAMKGVDHLMLCYQAVLETVFH
jgi:DNA polymerase-3 subunit epsilon/oligoribonuclease